MPKRKVAATINNVLHQIRASYVANAQFAMEPDNHEFRKKSNTDDEFFKDFGKADIFKSLSDEGAHTPSRPAVDSAANNLGKAARTPDDFFKDFDNIDLFSGIDSSSDSDGELIVHSISKTVETSIETTETPIETTVESDDFFKDFDDIDLFNDADISSEPVSEPAPEKKPKAATKRKVVKRKKTVRRATARRVVPNTDSRIDESMRDKEIKEVSAAADELMKKMDRLGLLDTDIQRALSRDFRAAAGTDEGLLEKIPGLDLNYSSLYESPEERKEELISSAIIDIGLSLDDIRSKLSDLAEYVKK